MGGIEAPHDHQGLAFGEVDVAQGLDGLKATGLPVNFGKANIEVRRRGISPGKGPRALALDVKGIEYRKVPPTPAQALLKQG